jgi:hypothetical protein
MKDTILLSVTRIVDDSTGCYNVGDLDFSVPCSTDEWLEKSPNNRQKLSEWLRWLASRCEEKRPPFGNNADGDIPHLSAESTPPGREG